MGCGANKGIVVPVAEYQGDEGNIQNTDRSSAETFVVSSGSAGITNESEIEDISISTRTSKGLAFEVPVHEEDVIKKHPPKRLQRLEDQQLPLLTHQLLEEKQAEAEQRRLQILSQRVQSARARQKLKRSLIGNEEGNEYLIEKMDQEISSVEL